MSTYKRRWALSSSSRCDDQRSIPSRLPDLDASATLACESLPPTNQHEQSDAAGVFLRQQLQGVWKRRNDATHTAMTERDREAVFSVDPRHGLISPVSSSREFRRETPDECCHSDRVINLNTWPPIDFNRTDILTKQISQLSDKQISQLSDKKTYLDEDCEAEGVDDELIVCPICCNCYGERGRERKETLCCHRHLCSVCLATILRQKTERRLDHEVQGSNRACPFCKLTAAGSEVSARPAGVAFKDIEVVDVCCADHDPSITQRISNFIARKLPLLTKCSTCVGVCCCENIVQKHEN